VTTQRAVQQQDCNYIPSSGKQFFCPSIIQPSRSTEVSKVAEVQNDFRFHRLPSRRLSGKCYVCTPEEAQISQWTVQPNVYIFTYSHCLLVTLPSAPQLSGKVQADAGFPQDKTAMLNAAIQEPTESRK